MLKKLRKKLVYKLIDKYLIRYLDENYFSWVLWCDDDVADAFNNIGVHNYTPEAIAEARKYWRMKFIDDVMTEDGWEIIDEAVRRTADELELVAEEG